MNLSKDTEAVVNFLNEFSEGSLRKKNDLGMLLETGATFSLDVNINNIIFEGASLWKLYKTIKQASMGMENQENLNRTFRLTAEKFNDLFVEIAEYIEDDSVRKRFDEIYFQNTDGTLKNLIDLAHDFSILKDFQNKMKRKDS